MEKLSKLCFAKPYVEIEKASSVFIITAVFQRTLFKYQDRGYRFILMEAGELAQNISLLCAAIGLGSCMIGGFMDDELAALIEINPDEESVICPIIVGKEKIDEKGDSNSR